MERGRRMWRWRAERVNVEGVMDGNEKLALATFAGRPP
jgi:hypothetical protein